LNPAVASPGPMASIAAPISCMILKQWSNPFASSARALRSLR